MTLSASRWRRVLVTCAAIGSLMALYEVTALDSRYAARDAWAAQPVPEGSAAGMRLAFSATAYCKGTTTSSGVTVRSGIVAADPALLPAGSVVRLSTGDSRYDGIYTVLDRGPLVRGKAVDVYMWSCHEALAFGRRKVGLDVIRLGWRPDAIGGSFVDRLVESGRSAVGLRSGD